MKIEWSEQERKDIALYMGIFIGLCAGISLCFLFHALQAMFQ